MPKGDSKSTRRSGSGSDANPTKGPARDQEKLAPAIRRPGKPAEKQVRETDRTLELAPPPRTGDKAAKGPAIDQRRQLVGTDEPKETAPRKSPGGGNRAEVAAGVRSGNKPVKQRTRRA